MTNTHPEWFKKPYKPQKVNDNRVNLAVCLIAGLTLLFVGIALSPLVSLTGVILTVLGVVLFATKASKEKD